MRQVITEIQDLTHLSWALAPPSSYLAGSFLKSYDDIGNEKVYYKLSDFRIGVGIVGHECINEIIIDRLLQILGVRHLAYQLIHAKVRVDGQVYETWLNATSDFKEPGESKLALDTYFQLEHKEGETPLAFCIDRGWSSSLWEMLVVDYLILNRDRHGANIEVLRNPRSRTLRLAPLFDHGLSLVCRCHTSEELASFDVMADLPVQSFVGQNSTLQNLSLIPTEEFPHLNPLCEQDRTILFEDLEEATSPQWREVVWNMIWKRWCSLADFCATR